MKEAVNVAVGAPIYRQGAFVLDKFLANQKEIQQNYPASELVLATVEDDFADELETLISSLGIKGKVLRYETIKPDYAQSRAWNIACGREAIRQYTLSQTEANYLLWLDADMTYDPLLIEILLGEIQGYDVVYSGYVKRDSVGYEVGSGCSMFTRDTLEKIRFRCLEFRNGQVIWGLCELDLIRLRSRVKKGFFLRICHYKNANEARCVTPQPLGWLRRVTTSRVVRYALIRASLLTRYHLSGKLQPIVYRFLGAIKET